MHLRHEKHFEITKKKERKKIGVGKKINKFFFIFLFIILF